MTRTADIEFVSTPAESAHPADPLPLRILVADDLEANRRLAVALLRNLGYSADAVASGGAAIEAAVAGGYDLVLMDVQMPDIDGLEATRQILARMGSRRPRIVAVTANALAGDRERCLQAGMDDYLSKPIQVQALRAVLEQPGAGTIGTPGAPGADAVAASGTIDWSRIESLARFDPDGTMVAAVMVSFLRDAPGSIAAIRAAYAAADVAGVAAAAHALKGAAANIGAANLQALSQRIETSAREAELGGARTAIGELGKALDDTRAALASREKKV